MGSSVRFLHSADLHIGDPVRGVSEITPVWEKRLDQAFVEAFDRLVDTALRREVDFVILAGDCFDTAGASFEDRERFKEALARLHEKDIPVYGCAGNHDPLSIWRKQFAYPPEGLVMFPEEAPGFAIYEKEGRPQGLSSEPFRSRRAYSRNLARPGRRRRASSVLCRHHS